MPLYSVSKELFQKMIRTWGSQGWQQSPGLERGIGCMCEECQVIITTDRNQWTWTSPCYWWVRFSKSSIIIRSWYHFVNHIAIFSTIIEIWLFHQMVQPYPTYPKYFYGGLFPQEQINDLPKYRLDCRKLGSCISAKSDEILNLLTT